MTSPVAKASERPSSDLVRRTFLDFFAARGHEAVPSASLLPQNDPTLNFVNAGMVPFKDVFTGKDQRPYKRATSSQKCIRISGKHNDLENVGVTARHHTFFEMLGNFSFGDYFKEDAIAYAWELLTKVYEIPESRLVITVFKGEEGLPGDDEAAAIWRKVTGFSDDRILRLGKADNFWSMGDTGPCGPCSEIHYFHGGEVDLSRFGEEPRLDGSGWTEIWNLVFMQFDRAEKDGPLVALPAPSIDTGMGLERVACVLQGVTSNYDTDLLRPLVDKASALAGKPYGGTLGHDDVSMRVIADHARTTAFMMAEGITPDRAGRSYVLRRVMRRAIRHGHRLGIEKPFLHEVALEVVERMGAVYPGLRDRKELIAMVTHDEEVRFRETIDRGLDLIARNEVWRTEGQRKILPGDVAFKLYDTFGFPLDLTQVIGAEQGFDVDVPGYDAALAEQKAQSGTFKNDAQAVDPAYREALTKLGQPVTFTGYEHEEGKSKVAALVLVTEQPGGKAKRALVDRAEAGARVEVVVSATPFYGEAGGQVGDRGTITAAGLKVEINDTQKPVTGLVVHEGKILEGALSVGDEVTLHVDHAARTATRRNHSATHVLHWALRSVLGEHAQQKGSRVGPDVLRFDFTHGKPLTAAEIQRIEDMANEKILGNAPVVTEILSMDEAKRRGAMAIFEEKYGDTVRMLTMTSEVVELCGGTHARALGDIGLFKITSEGGVAAGVRRIFAATGMNALRAVRDAEAELGRARAAVRGGDLVDKIGRIVAHERELEKKVAELERKLIDSSGASPDATMPGGTSVTVQGPSDRAREIGGIKVLAERVADGTNAGVLRDHAERLRDKIGGRSAVLLGSVTDGKAQLVAMVTKEATDKLKAGDLIKAVAAVVGGRGGGRPDMAQAGGPDVAKLDEAIAAAYTEAARLVGVS